MSNFPSAPPYGANYGNQPQQNASYPSSYQNPYTQQDDGRNVRGQAASNFNASMAAYGYNNSLPGFSAGSSAAPPLPLYQGWNQDAIALTSYSTPQNAMPYNGYGNSAFQPPQPPIPYSASQQQPYLQNTQQGIPYDEGEVSEGDFDAYGVRKIGQVAPAGYGTNYFSGNDGTGYMNTAHRAVFPSGQDYNNQQYASGNEYHNAPRESASYSPYTPTVPEAGLDERSKRKRSHNAFVSAPPIEQTVAPRTYTPTVRTPASKVPTLKAVNRFPATVQSLPTKPSVAEPVAIPQTVFKSRSPAPQPSFPDVQSSSGFKSVDEAQKKAEGAILNLWPSDVRFPMYVAEGLDEKIVGRLFDKLGLSKASKPLAGVADEKSPSEPAIVIPSNEHKLAGSVPETVDFSLAQSNITTNLPMLVDSTCVPSSSGVGETEKEREVLVEKNGNGVLPPGTNQIKPKEPTEKDKALWAKMEKLRKSRENRKSAAQTTTIIAPPSKKDSTSIVEQSQSSIILSLPQPHMTVPEIPSQPSVPPPPTIQLPSIQPPVIPGLYLASNSSPAPSAVPPGVINGITQITQRKRPVAADFAAPMSATPFKRPFGQSRNDSLVIDVSEEEFDSEDEDVAMELESQADQASPLQSIGKMSDQRAATIQNLPVLTNFPNRKAFASPPGSSAAGTPPIPKQALGHPQVLQQKETEIEALKKKIAQAEAAKAAKRRTQQISSGAATPQQHAAIDSSGTSNVNCELASRVEASFQIQQMIGMADEQIASDQNRLAETQVVEQEKSAEVKHNEAEIKRLRREKIATEIPRFDAEVEQSQLKLQQLRDEMNKLEAAVQKSKEDKMRMTEEMERLGQEAEDQLQEQKEKLKVLTNTDIPSTTESPRAVSSPIPEINGFAALPVSPSQAQKSPSLEIAAPVSNGSIAQSLVLKSHENESKYIGSDVNVAADQAMEAALQETIRADADCHEEGHEAGQETDLEMEDSYAPNPAQLAPESPPNILGPLAGQAIEAQLNAPADVELEIPSTQVDSAMDNEDDYEPPEATPPVDCAPTQSPPFSPSPPEFLDKPEDIAVDTRAVSGLAVPVAEDDSEMQMKGILPHLVEANKETPNQIPYFSPYESPLKQFRAFRFHPGFKQEVSGGLRSMTYSHKMDPETEFCRFELAGGVCNDKSCEFQHFKDITLPDDTILSTLGSPEEFPADQQQKFREGLREVLTGLRARKVRDFDTIAAEVVAHRSKFLGDPSKVLMLEGTTV